MNSYEIRVGRWKKKTFVFFLSNVKKVVYENSETSISQGLPQVVKILNLHKLSLLINE